MGIRSIVDHVLAMALFIAMLVEFLLVKQAGTSTFFLLTMIGLVDVLVGFIVSVRSSQRQVEVERAPEHDFGEDCAAAKNPDRILGGARQRPPNRQRPVIRHCISGNRDAPGSARRRARVCGTSVLAAIRSVRNSACGRTQA